MISRKDRIILISTAFWLFLVELPVPLAAIIVAAKNSTDPCLVVDEIGINLAQWLLGSGIGVTIAICSLITLLLLMACYGSRRALKGIITVRILNSLYSFCYVIIGMVVLIRSNSQCVREGTDLGIVTVLVITLELSKILVNFCISGSYGGRSGGNLESGENSVGLSSAI